MTFDESRISVAVVKLAEEHCEGSIIDACVLLSEKTQIDIEDIAACLAPSVVARIEKEGRMAGMLYTEEPASIEAFLQGD